MIEELIGAFSSYGFIDTLDTFTGVWPYKLFIITYYVITTLFYFWLRRKAKWSHINFYRIFLLSMLITILFAPTIVALGAAVFMPIAVISLIQIFADSNYDFVSPNFSILLVFWLVTMVIITIKYRKYILAWHQHG